MTKIIKSVATDRMKYFAARQYFKSSAIAREIVRMYEGISNIPREISRATWQISGAAAWNSHFIFIARGRQCERTEKSDLNVLCIYRRIIFNFVYIYGT